MNGTTDKETHLNLLFRLLFIAALLVNIKGIFTDYNIDSGYAIATSYRQLLGDKMISDMWEPHQTSAFLCTFLMWIYTSVTHTTTGLVIFLHTAGVIIKAGLTSLVYYTLKPFVGYVPLTLMCIFFFTVTPKGMVLPEFSNMQLWFSLCLFCCLIRHFEATEHKRNLFLSGLFLCLTIISYPSCIIMYFAVVLLIMIYSSSKWIDILFISLECLSFGILYIGYFVRGMGWSTFILNCSYIIAGDTSHSDGYLSKFAGYGEEIFYFGIIFLVLTVISFIISKLFHKNMLPIFFILVFLCDFLKTITSTTSYFERFPIYIPILFFSAFTIKKCNATEKKIYTIGMLLSLSCFVATLLLTNLSFVGSSFYLILCLMVALIPITKYLEELFCGHKTTTYIGLFIFLALTILHCGYAVKCMGGQKTNILHIGNIVKSGPALGIFSEYMGPHIMNTTINEMQEYISPGDNVFIVSAETLDPLMYLYQDNLTISCASTICTPTYNEKLLRYWELHPDKYPDVVMVECWYGDERVGNTWFIDWLNNEFNYESYIDGTYWRFYYR